MSTTLPIPPRPSGSVASVGSAKLQEVRLGLRLMMIGYMTLALSVTIGVGLLGLSAHAARELELSVGLAPEEAVGLGWAIAVVGAAAGYLFLLAGHWRCLAYAPQRHGGKEFLFASLLCVLGCPLFLAGAQFLGGQRGYVIFLRGLDGREALDVLRSGGFLQLTGGMLGLLNMLLFSGFLKGVAKYVGDRRREHSVTCYFWFVAFLLGGTAGLFLFSRPASHGDLLLCLAAGWLLSLAWHVYLMLGTAKRIRAAPRGEEPPRLTYQRLDTEKKTKAYSGVHRVYYVRTDR